MNKVEAENFPFYQFGLFSAYPEILHFISSGQKNIGFTDGIEPGIIRQNRLDLAQAVGFCAEKWVTGHQIHSVHVSVVPESEGGRGALDKGSRLPDTDALVTDCPGICLMVLSADCVPILLYDPHCRVVAAIHAGWRGTAGCIVMKTVEMMQQKFGCCPDEIIAGIGPSIGPCCFEVGEEVAGVFRDLFPLVPEVVIPGRCRGKFHVDLWEANCRELLSAGLKPENIEVAGICTVCHPDKFFSYRREGLKAGRFGAGIMLRHP